jgi:hypothetical protein
VVRADRLQNRFGAGRELKRLVNHLREGKPVQLMAGSRYGASHGLVVLAGRRLLFVMDGLTRQTTEDFPLDEQLRKLGELRDLGVVTPDEFDAEKRGC